MWSADGSEIFFYSAGGERPAMSPPAVTQDGGLGIWKMAADGSGRTRVTPPGVEAMSPSPGPDGRIAYNTREDAGYDAVWDVVSVSAAGDDPRSETGRAESCWIPDFHPSRGMVCHGPGSFDLPEAPVGGFEEEPLLFPGYPARSFVGQTPVELYSMNHGLSVPPHPTTDQVLVSGSSPEGPPALFVSRVDGSESRMIVAADRGALMSMRWAKDGALINYSVGAFGGGAAAYADVWSVRPDGSELTNLTNDSTANDAMGDFTAGGRSLVFRSGRGGAFELYVMPTIGGEATRLTTDDFKDNFPSASPVGEAVAFVSDRDGIADIDGNKDFDIYLLDLVDGEASDIRRVTTSRGQDSHVQFSPDGEWLIYTSEKGGINDEEPLVQELMFNPQMYGEIFAYHIANGTSVRLTHNKWEDGGPFWAGPVTSPATLSSP